MIPRRIHCFWAGGPKTGLAKRCLASWRRFAPDWTVHEWTADELRRVAAEPGLGLRFFEAAVSAGKWAMASDWARMLALWLEGGVYFDFDVELVAPAERLPDCEWIAGEWTVGGSVWMNPGGGIALEKGSTVARRMLAAYDGALFDPEREMMPWINDMIGEALRSSGGVGVRVLPPEVLNPVRADGRICATGATVGIHHYAMGGASRRRRLARWLSWHGLDWLVRSLSGRRTA